MVDNGLQSSHSINRGINYARESPQYGLAESNDEWTSSRALEE